MTPAEKQAFVAKMAAARGKKPAPQSSQPMSQPMTSSHFGTCPKCGNSAGMMHSC